MSKFTTEVRFICETAAGLEESKGYNSVAEILNNVANIVMPNYPIFDEAYRKVLNTKILKHYYTREIGMETVGLWKLHMDERMNLIMPKYNKLYESALIEYGIFDDVDLTTTREIDGGRNENKQATTIGSASTNENESSSETIDRDSTANNSSETISANAGQNASEAKQVQKYSDMPQGGITNLENSNYLTNATIDEKSGGGSDSTMGTAQSEGSQVFNEDVGTTGSRNNNTQRRDSEERTEENRITNTEDYLEHIVGKHWATGSKAKMIKEYRDTIINVDQMIIDELSDLFFGLWE